MAMVGKWFSRRLGPAMGVYSVLLAVGFIAGTIAVGSRWKQTVGARRGNTSAGFSSRDWCPSSPFSSATRPKAVGSKPSKVRLSLTNDRQDLTRRCSKRSGSPAFWCFTLAAATFGLIWAAVTLFNQALLEDRGFGDYAAKASITVLAILSGCGLLSNMLGGWLAMKWPLGRLNGVAMLMLAASLALFPIVHSMAALMMYAVALGVAGGLLTVVFFTFYRQAFGQSNLGGTQGAGHVLATMSSARPHPFDGLQRPLRNYDPFFWGLGPRCWRFGLACWRVPLPNAVDGSALKKLRTPQ